MDPITMAAIAGGIVLFSGFMEGNSKNKMLKMQASLYEQNAKTALYEGQVNAGNIAAAGEYVQGSLMSNYGASGVDVNNSQTVSNEQRILQKGINDDVYTMMYNAATEAKQMRINAQMARYQGKSGMTNSLLGAAGNVAMIGMML